MQKVANPLTKIMEVLSPVPLTSKDPGKITDKEYMVQILKSALALGVIGATGRAAYGMISNTNMPKELQTDRIKSQLNTTAPILSINADMNDKEEERLKREMGLVKMAATDSNKASLSKLLYDAAIKDKSILLSFAAATIPVITGAVAWDKMDNMLDKRRVESEKDELADMDNLLNKHYHDELVRTGKLKPLQKTAAKTSGIVKIIQALRNQFKWNVPINPAKGTTRINKLYKIGIPATILTGGATASLPYVADKILPEGVKPGGPLDSGGKIVKSGFEGMKSLYAMYAALAIMGGGYVATKYLNKTDPNKNSKESLKRVIEQRAKVGVAPSFTLDMAQSATSDDIVSEPEERKSLAPVKMSDKEISI
jgi:hypothetical protein